jgi:integrase
MDQRAAGIIRLCMLTGSRVGEVRQARFEQFNLELGSWSKPAATTKQRKIHRIPISAEVAASRPGSDVGNRTTPASRGFVKSKEYALW